MVVVPVSLWPLSGHFGLLRPLRLRLYFSHSDHLCHRPRRFGIVLTIRRLSVRFGRLSGCVRHSGHSSIVVRPLPAISVTIFVGVSLSTHSGPIRRLRLLWPPLFRRRFIHSFFIWPPLCILAVDPAVVRLLFGLRFGCDVADFRPSLSVCRPLIARHICLCLFGHFSPLSVSSPVAVWLVFSRLHLRAFQPPPSLGISTASIFGHFSRLMLLSGRSCSVTLAASVAANRSL